MNTFIAKLEEQERNCEKHGLFTSEHYRLFGSNRWTTCDKCAEEAAEQQDADKERAKLERRLKCAGISARFAEKDLHDYQVKNDRQKTAVALARLYAKNFPQNRKAGRCLLFLGKPGTGKTHLGIGIVKQVIEQGYTAKYITVGNLIQAIRSTWRDGAQLTEGEVIDDFASVDLLVMDEVGAQYGKESEALETFKVVNRRYDDLKPSLLIGNTTLEEFKKVICERAYDRLRGAPG